MQKVADVSISEDFCGPYSVKLKGTDAIYFQLINNELYFLLEEPNICKSLYTVTVSIEDLAGRFTPKTAVYTLSTNGCHCTTTTTIAPTTTTTTTTVIPVTTTTTTTTTSSPIGPYGLNFAAVENGATIGLGGTVTSDTYIGPNLWGARYNLMCEGAYSWGSLQALCTQGSNTNYIYRSIKNTTNGTTFTGLGSSTSPFYMVIDLGQVRTFSMARYYQMYSRSRISDGKTTHVALDVSSNGALNVRSSPNWTEVHGFTLLDNSQTSNGIEVIFPYRTARYIRLRLYNDGRYGSLNYTELYNFKLFHYQIPVYV
jgi:hypothetical protein